MSETVTAFGRTSQHIGTFCLPSPAIPRENLGIILFNAGVLHRIGPNRVNVRFARALAAVGISSLRFDLAGQGDSERSRNAGAFEAQAIADLQEAMNHFEQQHGLSRFVLFGFCSGGVHSFSTAQVDPRVVGLILYDTYIFPTLKARFRRYWASIQKKGIWVSGFGWAMRKWRKVLDVVASGGVGTPAPPIGNALFTWPTKREFIDKLNGLLARGVAICIPYSAGFQEYNYAEQFSDAFATSGLPERIESPFFAGADHTLTLLVHQRALIEYLVSWCLKRRL